MKQKLPYTPLVCWKTIRYHVLKIMDSWFLVPDSWFVHNFVLLIIQLEPEHVQQDIYSEPSPGYLLRTFPKIYTPNPSQYIYYEPSPGYMFRTLTSIYTQNPPRDIYTEPSPGYILRTLPKKYTSNPHQDIYFEPSLGYIL